MNITLIIHTDDPRELHAGVLIGDVGMIKDFHQIHLLLYSYFLLCGQEVVVHASDVKIALQTGLHARDHTHQDEPRADKKASRRHLELFRDVTTEQQ